MANMRKCQKCGKIENSYTYFCTECGTKTVDYVDNGSKQQTSNVSVDKPIKKSDFSTVMGRMDYVLKMREIVMYSMTDMRI